MALPPGSSFNSCIDNMYKLISLSLAIAFAIVGCLFLIAPGGVLGFFNRLSGAMGFERSADQGPGLYVTLAVAYMYVVTVLAFFMYRHPENGVFPLLLVHAKSASALVSLWFFAFHRPYLVLLVNGVVDGAIAAGVFLLRRNAGRDRK